MPTPTRATLLQLYLLSVCFLSLIGTGITGTAALLGSLRLHYPRLTLSAEQWSVASSFDGYVATLPADQAHTSDTAKLMEAWQQQRRSILRREHHLGQRQLVYWATGMLVALTIFLPHWWAARRFARRE